MQVTSGVIIFQRGRNNEIKKCTYFIDTLHALTDLLFRVVTEGKQKRRKVVLPPPRVKAGCPMELGE